MKILAIDTSGLVASVAILDGDSMLSEYMVNYKKTHSETLMPMIAEIIHMTETDKASFDAIAIAGGPGSFTGLRIGSATAKGIAQMYDLPIISVPTVDALAYNIWATDSLVVPIMDARRNQTYTGIYEYSEDGEMKVLMEQCAISVEELVEKLNGMGRSVIFLGDGVVRFKELIDGTLKVSHKYAPVHHSRQRAGAVAVLGAKYYEQGKYTTAEEHEPEYLRKSQAEREREERNA